MPKPHKRKRKRKPLKGTGGALARSGGSVRSQFKSLGTFRPKRKKK